MAAKRKRAGKKRMERIKSNANIAVKIPQM